MFQKAHNKEKSGLYLFFFPGSYEEGEETMGWLVFAAAVFSTTAT